MRFLDFHDPLINSHDLIVKFIDFQREWETTELSRRIKARFESDYYKIRYHTEIVVIGVGNFLYEERGERLGVYRSFKAASQLATALYFRKLIGIHSGTIPDLVILGQNYSDTEKVLLGYFAFNVEENPNKFSEIDPIDSIALVMGDVEWSTPEDEERWNARCRESCVYSELCGSGAEHLDVVHGYDYHWFPHRMKLLVPVP